MSPVAAGPTTKAPTVTLETLADETRAALDRYLLAVADDAMLQGHRDAEWTGLGPILEEDIAFSSMAQDEMGHALVWYRLREAHLGAPDPNTQAFTRDAPDWRNAQLVELPRGDYAFSLARQYLHHLAEAVRLDALRRSAWRPMAEAAVKLRQEKKYHLTHGKAYLQRLARGTDDSHARLQDAIDRLFPYALGLWEPPPGEAQLVAAEIVPPSDALRRRWLDAATRFLTGLGLSLPVEERDDGFQPTVTPVTGGRQGEHSEALPELLAAMQGLYRSDPEATW